MKAMAQERPKVIIVGGGFGGLVAAKTLARAPVDVILIDPETRLQPVHLNALREGVPI